MSDLVKLEWYIQADEFAEAHTPFGTYWVTEDTQYGWEWSYELNEYKEEGDPSCEDIDDGISLAEKHWRGCVQPITKPLTDRIEELEVKLARAVEAMREAIRLSEQPHYGDIDDALDHCFDAIDVLRITIAELTGGKDE